MINQTSLNSIISDYISNPNQNFNGVDRLKEQISVPGGLREEHKQPIISAQDKAEEIADLIRKKQQIKRKHFPLKLTV